MSRLIGLALAFACVSTPVVAAPPPTLTAVTFNLLHGGATSPRHLADGRAL